MKIGDIVKIIGIFGQDKIDPRYIGMTGVINNISSGDEYPYEISFDDGSDNNFTEDELELVNSKFSIGARVKVNNNYSIHNIRNLEGTVVVINDGIGVDFGRIDSNFHTLESHLKNETERWFHESEISLISKSIPISKDFYVICSNKEELELMVEWANWNGYNFYQHADLDISRYNPNTYNHLNFTHAENNIYFAKGNTFSLDNNNQMILQQRCVKDLINKKEIMNEEIERVLREGDAAMKMHDKGKIKVVSTSFDVPNMLASVTKVKCSNDDTTIHQIKKRARKVGYIAHRLKI